MKISDRYPARVFWSDEDEGFIATAPDLPGSSAFGETKAEALAQLEDAIEGWIEAAKAAGNPIPEPSRPAVEPQASGKLLVRMPKSLHAGLVQAAKHENVSLNHYVVFLLTMAYRAAASNWTASNFQTMTTVTGMTSGGGGRGEWTVSGTTGEMSVISSSTGTGGFPNLQVIGEISIQSPKIEMPFIRLDSVLRRRSRPDG
jgi:antitoxin HicB